MNGGGSLKFKGFLKGLICFFAIIGLVVVGAVTYCIITNQYSLGSLVKLVWLMENESLKDKSRTIMVQGAMKGIVDAINDPYSTYLSKAEFEDLDVRIQGSFSGVGIVVAADKDNRITVVAPLRKSPAARAVIKSGDIITNINGDTTKGMTVEDAVELIRGEIGTQVEITVFRESDKDEHVFKVIRDNITVDSVDSRMIKKEPAIAYVQISQFTSQTPEEFRKHMQNMLDKGAKGLILDLREDPGGDFASAVEIADTILSRGTIVKIADRNGKSEVYSASAGGLNMPIVVLVNKGSASSAEILAGALKDNKVAVLVGEKTYGKGLVQTVFPLHGGDALKLTTDKYYTPNGTDINQIGIVPDYVVDNPPNAEPDAQLQKATDIVMTKLSQ